MSSSIEPLIQQVVARQLRVSPDVVRRDAELLADLGADSLALAELTCLLEKEFGGKLSAEDLLEVNTVGDLIDVISARTS